MKRLLFCLLATPLIGGCATDPYGNNVESRTIGGVLLGGALGALGGHAAGMNAVSGAAAGMVVGGAAGYALGGPTGQKRQYYKDSQGYCYFVDSEGVSHYDEPPVRC